jgi:hypothetical protein
VYTGVEKEIKKYHNSLKRGLNKNIYPNILEAYMLGKKDALKWVLEK